jgi:hypothetical protein
MTARRERINRSAWFPAPRAGRAVRPERQRSVGFDPEAAEPKGAVIDPARALVIAAALGLVVRED